MTILIKQGGHRPGKPGIIREFETSGNIREKSGNSPESQGIFGFVPKISDFLKRSSRVF